MYMIIRYPVGVVVEGLMAQDGNSDVTRKNRKYKQNVSASLQRARTM